jgi:hypothetical protein
LVLFLVLSDSCLKNPASSNVLKHFPCFPLVAS